jgi:hypothetical protein
VLLHETLVCAPGNACRLHRGALGAQPDPVRVQIMQVVGHHGGRHRDSPLCSGMGAKEAGMFLYVRKSFMIFKLVLACIAFLAAIIALLGTPQNSLLLTQETGRQLGVVMALVFGIITIVEAFMAPPEAIISEKILSGGKPEPHSAVVGLQKSGE